MFGPSLVPILQVGFRGAVMCDAGFRAHMNSMNDYKSTCGKTSWDSMLHYATQLKQKKVKIAFFSSTPQGGGVALMRHALVRFSRLVGVDLTWYGMLVLPFLARVCLRHYVDKTMGSRQRVL